MRLILVTKKVDLFEPGDHASTFGGNPFACKAGITVATEIERRNLLKNVTDRGVQLKEGLLELTKKYPSQLKGVRGLGLMQGLLIKEETNLTANNVANAAILEKLLLVSAGEKVVRIVPPLTISRSETRQLLLRLDSTLESLS